MGGKGVFALMFVLLAGVGSQNKNFLGGAMSFRFLTTTGESYMVEMTYMTGWQVSKGPCGLACGNGDLRSDTTITRKFMLNTYGDDFLGVSAGEMSFRNGSIVPFSEPLDVTGQVAAVNTFYQWEQEIAVTLLLINPGATQTEISLGGLSWQEYDYRYEGDTNFRLYQKIQPTRRNDTGTPNNSPVAMFKPKYIVPLNTVSVVRLAVVDVDDDFVRCEESLFISAGAVKMLNNTVVLQDCSVVIEANEEDGFVDGGTGVVTVKVSDYNRKSISLDGSDVRLGGERFRSLNDVNLQFMVQTVKTVVGPQFVSPTKDSQHVFIVYVGSTLSIPLYANKTIFSEIALVSLRTIPDVPEGFMEVAALQNDTLSREGVKYTTVSWQPTVGHVGVYVLGVIVTDILGYDGMDRNYVIIVREKSIWESPGIPSKNLTYECTLGASCTFPVYSSSAADKYIMEIRETSSSLSNPEISVPRKVLLEGTEMFTSDVTVVPGVKGPHAVCVKAIDDARTESVETCLNVTVTIQDPCWSGPCYNGQCASEGEIYTCLCQEGYTGVNCEQAIAMCEAAPCQNGAQCFEGLNRGDFVCLCREGFTGILCETDSMIASSVPQTSSPPSTLQGRNSSSTTLGRSPISTTQRRPSTSIKQVTTSPSAELGQQQRLDSKENPDESTPSYVIPVVVSSVLLVCAVAGALLVWRRFFSRKNKLDVETDHVIKEDDVKCTNNTS